MVPRSRCSLSRSESIMSYRASNKGRRYGSTFSIRPPGRKPSFSPASTAGRVKMTRATSPDSRAEVAMAMAR